MSIGEQMKEALDYDHHLLAHGLFLGLQKGYWQANDPAESADFDKLDFAELEKVTAENVLSVETNKLHTIPMGNKVFAMYFASDIEAVKTLHRKRFGQLADKVFVMEHGLDLSMYHPETNKHQTWREIRSEMPDLPAYAGLFQK